MPPRPPLKTATAGDAATHSCSRRLHRLPSLATGEQNQVPARSRSEWQHSRALCRRVRSTGSTEGKVTQP